MILTEVYVPALNSRYDFKLDENTYIAYVLDELGSIMLPPSEAYEKGIQELLLCSYETRRILSPDRTLKEEGVGNGSRLMLI